MKKFEKTNVMRILDQKKAEYTAYSYETDVAISGTEVARILGKSNESTFKTLVTVGESKKNYVFVIPVHRELDLKKAAKAVGEKNIAMIKSKELLSLTGYVHGGCSPIGMKKLFITVLDESAQFNDKIMFSAGKIGYQVEMSPSELKKIVDYKFGNLTAE